MVLKESLWREKQITLPWVTGEIKIRDQKRMDYNAHTFPDKSEIVRKRTFNIERE